ncbi:serine/threonine-protein kinase [Paraliomyxa miuraensis]|uniref:serine/threonine-protein kinase n=1 Tax=Paraliomyxa miuraensis TaxID=376150 RepID=UPI0022569C61|nr:serine/threonine-protein kinase [Paraliomyxa miuraensis]MCX4241147.1 serine/threonine-protein kinase [Paraliomyxa miuraensis]
MGSSADAVLPGDDTVDVRRVQATRTRTRPVVRPSRADRIADRMPERIGRYRIERRLGAGGMGVVYQALDERVGRAVALKLVLVGDAEVDRERLRREARALARLSHPNVVEVFEIGEHHDPDASEPPHAYVVMELIDGSSLDRWLRLRRRTPAELVPVFIQAGEGLAAAHAQGLVHRDFKPGNVLVGNDGRVRVVDFGLVREVDADERRAPASGDGSAPAVLPTGSGESLTKTGAIVGTPAYMSPEQLAHLPVDPRSDQFSFCVALYEALFGQHPFVVDEAWSMLPFNVLEGTVVPPPADRRVSQRLTAAILRGLAVRPQERWPSMDALLSELRRALEPRGPWPWLAALAVGVLAAVPWALDWSPGAGAPDRCEEAAAIMAEAWGRSARERLRSAWLEAGRQSHADTYADTWSRVDARMQSYADDWWQVHHATCSDPPRSVPASLCLARLADGVRTRLQLLAEPSEGLVEHAVAMVGTLPSVDRCRAALDEPAEAAPPHEPPWADELDRVDAYEHAGRFEEASAQVELLLARAERERDLLLLAEAKRRAGSLKQRLGDVTGAAELLEQAHLEAKHLGRDRLAAEAALAMLELLGKRSDRIDDASRWARHARVELERLDDPLLTSRFYDAWGRAQRGAGKLEESLALHRQALALQREHGEPGARSSFELGTCLALLGRFAEGRPYLDQALASWRDELGPKHPQVARALTNLGLMLMAESSDAEALDAFEQAFGILRESAPNDPEASWSTLLNLSSIHRLRGDSSQATRPLYDYLELVERSPEPVDPSRVDWVHGEIAMLEQRYEDAVVLLERAALGDGVQRYEKTRGLMNVATALDQLGRPDEAIAAHRRAVEALEPRPGSTLDSIDRNDWLLEVHSLAYALSTRGDHETALGELRRARERLDGHDPVGMATLELRIGTELDALGRQGEAVHALRASVRTLEAEPGASPVVVVDALWSLARAELAVGERTAALEHAEAAARRTETLGEQARAYFEPRGWFLLARCLGDSREQQQRARELATRARDRFVEQGEAARAELDEIQAWLERRR